MDITKNWSLQMFAEGGEGASAPGGNGTEGQQGTMPGNAAQPADQANGAPAAPAKTPFEELLKDPEYKAAFDRRVRSALANRFKGVNAERAAMLPLMTDIGGQYGIDVSDPERMDYAAIAKAYAEDRSRLEKEAMEHGYAVDDWAKVKEAEQIKQQRVLEQREAASRQLMEQTMAESEQLKQIYPGFDLEAELLNPQFGNLLVTLQHSGFPDAVRTAYESVHRDEIMGGAMQYAVQKTKQQMANAIQAGAQRPAENGAATAPAQSRVNPANMTPQQRREIRERAMRGEHITFR